MTETDLINKICKQTKVARELLEQPGNYYIKRGMAHSVSGYCEDIFAVYIANKLQNPELRFFVDKVISTRYSKDQKSTSFKPDLAIINEDKELTHYFDLKTNLGWNRQMKEYVEKKNNLIKNLINVNKAWITGKKEWSDFDKMEITVSPNLQYHIVVIFGGNINEKTMNENIDFINTLDFVKIDILKPTESSLYDSKAFDSIEDSLNSSYSILN